MPDLDGPRPINSMAYKPLHSFAEDLNRMLLHTELIVVPDADRSIFHSGVLPTPKVQTPVRRLRKQVKGIITCVKMCEDSFRDS